MEFCSWVDLEKEYHQGSLQDYLLKCGNSSFPKNLFQIIQNGSKASNNTFEGVTIIRNILQTAPALKLRELKVEVDVVKWIFSFVSEENTKLTLKAVSLGTLGLLLKNCQVNEDSVTEIVEIVGYAIENISILIRSLSVTMDTITYTGVVMMIHQIEDLLNLLAVKGESVLIPLHKSLLPIISILSCMGNTLPNNPDIDNTINIHSNQYAIDTAKVSAMIMEIFLTYSTNINHKKEEEPEYLSTVTTTINLDELLKGLNNLMNCIILSTIVHDSYLSAIHYGSQLLCLMGERNKIEEVQREAIIVFIQQSINYISQKSHLLILLNCKRIDMMIGILTSYFEKNFYAFLAQVLFPTTQLLYSFIHKMITIIQTLQINMKSTLLSANTSNGTRQELKMIYSDIRKGCIACCEQLFTVDTVYLTQQLFYTHSDTDGSDSDNDRDREEEEGDVMVNEEQLQQNINHLFHWLMKGLNTCYLFPIVYHTIHHYYTTHGGSDSMVEKGLMMMKNSIELHILKAMNQFSCYSIHSSEEIIQCLSTSWQENMLIGIPTLPTTTTTANNTNSNNNNILSLLMNAMNKNIPKLPSATTNTITNKKKKPSKHQSQQHEIELWKWKITIVSSMESYYQTILLHLIPTTSTGITIMIDHHQIVSQTIPWLSHLFDEEYVQLVNTTTANNNNRRRKNSNNNEEEEEEMDQSIELKQVLLSLFIVMIDYILANHTNTTNNNNTINTTDMMSTIVCMLYNYSNSNNSNNSNNNYNNNYETEDDLIERQQLISLWMNLLYWYNNTNTTITTTTVHKQQQHAAFMVWNGLLTIIIFTIPSLSSIFCQPAATSSPLVVSFASFVNTLQACWKKNDNDNDANEDDSDKVKKLKEAVTSFVQTLHNIHTQESVQGKEVVVVAEEEEEDMLITMVLEKVELIVRNQSQTLPQPLPLPMVTDLLTMIADHRVKKEEEGKEEEGFKWINIVMKVADVIAYLSLSM